MPYPKLCEALDSLLARELDRHGSDILELAIASLLQSNEPTEAVAKQVDIPVSKGEEAKQ